jgi:hypothetical protein
MTEYANISIERYTDMIVEIEKLKYELEKERIDSERRLASLAEYEGKYNEMAQNIFNHLIGNNDALYSWDKEMLIRSGITNDEIERMTKVHNENKISRESNGEENE